MTETDPQESPDRKSEGAGLYAAAREVMASRYALIAALLVATLLRVLHLSWLNGSLLADAQILDHQAYDEWAQRIAKGEWLSGRAFFVDPLYSYFLAVLYKIFGRHILLVRGLQCGLGVANVAMTGFLARRITRSAAVGNAAAWLAALFVPLIHYEVQLEKAALTTALATAALLLVLRGTTRAAALAGFLLGLAVLSRGNLLVMLPAGALALYRPAPVRAFVFLAAASAMVAVLPMYNLLAAHEFLLTTGNGGQNLYIGQQRANRHGTYVPPPFVRPDPKFEQADFHAEAERRSGRTLSVSEVSRFWALAAAREVAADPRAALVRTVRKLRLVFHSFEVPDNDNMELAAGFSPILRLPFFFLGQLAPLAILGALVGSRRSREARIVAGAVSLYAGTLILFFISGRFRVPMVPATIALAAAGAAWLLEKLRNDDTVPALTGVLIIGFGFYSFTLRPEWLAELRRQSLAIGYHNMGTELLARRDVDGAIAAFEKAIATKPEAVVISMRILGGIYQDRKQYDRAEHLMQQVLAIKPDSPLGQQALLRLHAEMAGDGAAPARRLYALSREHRLAGRFPEAIAALKEVIRSGPYNEDARYSLGYLMEEHSSPEEMAAYFAAAVGSDPKPQTSLYFLAVALERRGDVAGAVGKLGEALRVDPAHEVSELRWCEILERRGDLPGALRHCDKAVEIFPDFSAGHKVRARILAALLRLPEAEAARQAAQRSIPNTPRRFFDWGRALMKAGRPELAIPELERFLSISKGDPAAMALLEEARRAVRNPAK